MKKTAVYTAAYFLLTLNKRLTTSQEEYCGTGAHLFNRNALWAWEPTLKTRSAWWGRKGILSQNENLPKKILQG